MSSSLDTPIAPSSSSSSSSSSSAPSSSTSTMPNSQSSPANAATNLNNLNSTENLFESDAASTSTKTEPTSTKSFDSTTATDSKFGSSDNSSTKKDDSMFECNICLDTAKEAVVSMCGHLFCWPCLHQWLETRPTRQLCPVCKAAISKEKVIPLYGRGSTKEEDPRYVLNVLHHLVNEYFKMIMFLMQLQFKSSTTTSWSAYRTRTKYNISRIWLRRWWFSNVIRNWRISVRYFYINIQFWYQSPCAKYVYVSSVFFFG